MLTALYPNSYHDSLVISFGNNIHNNELSQLSLASRLSNFFASSRIIYYFVFVIFFDTSHIEPCYVWEPRIKLTIPKYAAKTIVHTSSNEETAYIGIGETQVKISLVNL